MKLFSRIEGSGKPLVILHGLFGLGDNWAALSKRWAKHFEVHTLDLRNHGRSPHSTVWNYEAMANDVAEYLDDRNLFRDVVVLGHSMGGKTAMELAVQHANKLSALVVIDIGPHAYPVHHRSIINALLSVPLNAIQSRQEAELSLAPHISEWGIRQFLLKSLYRTDSGFDWRFNLQTIANQIEEVGKPLNADALFEGPTLFIRGSKSGYLTDEDLPVAHRHFPFMQLDSINQAGHWVHAEQPDALYQSVENFLRSKNLL